MRNSVRSLLLLGMLLVSAAHAGVTAGLVNLSTLSGTGAGADQLTVGVVIAPGASRTVLIRAVGPGLQQFGVAGFATDPVLTLFNSNSAAIDANDDWGAPAAPAAAAVGAFALTAGSKDAAIVRTLAPGAYTAQVSNRGAGSVVLIEVYDTGSGASGLVNLSARARVDSGADVLIPGIVVAPGNMRRLLVRAAGPALTTLAGLPGALADPALILVNNDTHTTIASNDNWDSPNDAAVYSRIFTQAGAFPFAAGSKDAALIADLGPGNYTAQVSGVGGAAGIALVEVYDVTPANINTVTIAAVKPQADETGSNPAIFRFTRTGDLSKPLTVLYTTGGTASAGVDYAVPPGSVTIPAGAASADIAISPLPDVENEPAETIALTLAPSLDYFLGRTTTASVSVANSPATLFLATLRPESAAASSTASGTATIVLNAAGLIARVTISFSNLSSAQTNAYLRLGAPGTDGAYLLALPTGQAATVDWFIQPTASYSGADIVNALKTGQVYVSIPTANFPTGELRGTMAQATGAQTFAPPPAAPALADAPLAAGDAARFLTQTTFGPVQADVDALTGAHLADLDAWITAQMGKPASSLLDATRIDYALEKQINPDLRRDPDLSAYLNRRVAWWKIALGADDQLRQRVAFALSELFVISDQNNVIYDWAEGAANYYDLLVRGAFGNFRDLLEQITLNPMMGAYLSHLKNAKAANGAYPDENFAREVMQLFTIGLYQLHPDGTLKLDAAGLPIATYDQTTVTEMAKVFTGWGFYQTVPDATFRSGGSRIESFMNPMVLYPAFHEDGPKTIVAGVQLAANQGGARDLQVTLDTLFNHPNTPPFVARQLIQRLVTANPSPAYVYRVAQKFVDNGAGVRGDLGAVVRAVLLDYEARSPAVAANPGFGHLKEPLLRLTALLRAFGATANSGRFAGLETAAFDLQQRALSSPTVFNFFSPDYDPPGALAAAGLCAPEFQILTAATAITVPDYLFNLINATRPASSASNTVYLSLDALVPNARNPAALLDQINVLLCGGSMPGATRDRIVTALNAFAPSVSDLDRVRNAVYLAAATSAAAVQK